MDRRPFSTVCFGVCGAILLGTGARAQDARGSGPTDHVARTVDEIPFSGGMLEIPSLGGTNNRGIIQGQTAAGQTHVDMVLHWRFLEPEKGRWNQRELDEMLALCRARKLKLLVLPEIIFTPEWFRKTRDYTPLTDMQTGRTVDMLSPWAPGTAAAFDYFYAELARRYGQYVDIIKIAYPGSDFGEVGMLMGAKCFLPGSNGYRFFPQDPAVWKMGYWCGRRWHTTATWPGSTPPGERVSPRPRPSTFPLRTSGPASACGGWIS
jgi:hypothetical protein